MIKLKNKKTFYLPLTDDHGKAITILMIEEKVDFSKKKQNPKFVCSTPHIIARGFPGGLVGYVPLNISTSEYNGPCGSSSRMELAQYCQYKQNISAEEATTLPGLIEMVLEYAKIREIEIQCEIDSKS